MSLSRGVAVSSQSISSMEEDLRLLCSHNSGNLIPPFSFFSSNSLSGRRKQPIIDLSCAQELDDAIHLFHEMVRMRPQPSVVDFTKLLNSFVKMKRYSVAFYLFDEMRQTGGPVNEYTLSITIKCYCLVKRVNLVCDRWTLQKTLGGGLMFGLVTD